MTENWIDFALHAVAGAIAFLCLFDATRRIGAYGLHRTAVLMFVFSSAACAFAGGFAYQKYSTLNAVAASNQRQLPPAKVVAASYIKPGATPEKKEHLGQVLARQTFMEFGALASYVDRNGETRTFVPAADDLKARERIVAYYTQTEFAARNSLAESLLWVIGAVVAVFLGLVMSLAKPPAPRSPDEADLAAEPPLHR
jgi:hypothetical protein